MVEQESEPNVMPESDPEVVMIGGILVFVKYVEPGGIERLKQEELRKKLAQGRALTGLTGRDLLPKE